MLTKFYISFVLMLLLSFSFICFLVLVCYQVLWGKQNKYLNKYNSIVCRQKKTGNFYYPLRISLLYISEIVKYRRKYYIKLFLM